MKKYIYIILVVSISAFSQEKALLKADKKYKQEQFIDAISIYEKLAKKGVGSIEIFERLGDSYYFNANYEKAFIWYQKLYELNANCSSEYLYRYAQCLKSIGNIDQAKTILELYSNKEKLEIRADLFHKFIGKANTDDKLSNAFKIKKLSINSSKSDYGGVLKGDTIVFSSARNQTLANMMYKRTNQSFTNLYYFTINSSINIPEPKLFSKRTFSKFHEATPAFSKDGKTMYFTQNEVKTNNKGKVVNGLYKIYKSVYKNGEWSSPEIIKIEAHDQSRIAHPALSPDEKYLYFASDMKGTFGVSDIFKIKINGDGTYGKPENLGSKINTEGRESYPFVTKDNKLLFASDGQPGFGGFDIFVLDLDNPNALPINIGNEINGPMDDFAMVWNRETRLGTFTSNRKGGMGDDDIYLIEEVNPFVFEIEVPLKGSLQDVLSKDFLPDAQLVLTDINDNIIATTKTDDKGKYSFDKIKTNQTYKIRIEKEGYETQQKTVTVSRFDTDINIPFVVSALQVKIDKGVDVATVIKFDQIYFDLDKSSIRDDAKVELEKIVEVLKSYPEIKIEIGSHTDARQHRKYNKILSQKRAESIVNYLVKRGISISRLTATGYGESMLVNKCADGIICSENDHQQNRRSTFIVVE
jgi:outer membrane protein OmpA-like peptidoglycan-associated protein/tetratricopeptide (TPR) repeat protein